jgi:hypothetical protein
MQGQREVTGDDNKMHINYSIIKMHEQRDFTGDDKMHINFSGSKMMRHNHSDDEQHKARQTAQLLLTLAQPPSSAAGIPKLYSKIRSPIKLLG